MAIVSSHILDSVNGGFAIGIRVALFRLIGEAEKHKLFEVKADAEGRIAESVEIVGGSDNCEYELEIHSAEYFAGQPLPAEKNSAMKTVVIRFSMSDSVKRHHLPLMLSPYSYSVWSSK